jgi:hypothetical protein
MTGIQDFFKKGMGQEGQLTMETAKFSFKILNLPLFINYILQFIQQMGQIAE